MKQVLISRCQIPQWNLALEEYLIEQKQPLLFLWQNEPSVILGRNQDPYAECRPAALQADGVHLVRRKSGGGAVYHDLGNLNITLLSPDTPEALEDNFSFLQAALLKLGVSAQRSGRNDLEVGGKKISGSAFYETEQMLCHHCTMLVRANAAAMEAYLTPNPLKLQSKGIASVRSRVCGLTDVQPTLTVETLQSALTQTYGGDCREISRADMEAVPAVREKAERYASWAWTYGESPKSNLTLERKFSWGIIKAELLIVNGLIKSCQIYTDSLRPDGFDALSHYLEGLPLYGDACRDAIAAFPDSQIRDDLQTLFCGG